MRLFVFKEKNVLKESHSPIFRRLRYISLLPFVVYTLFILIGCLLMGMDSFIWPLVVLVASALFVSGVGVVSVHKMWKIAAWISILLMTIGSIVIGYYDYFQWFSTKLCFGLDCFFLIIVIVKRYFSGQ